MFSVSNQQKKFCNSDVWRQYFGLPDASHGSHEPDFI